MAIKKKKSAGLHLMVSKRGKYRKRKNGTRVFIKTYYWCLIARNGRELARSSENYNTKASAVKGIEAVSNHFEGHQHYYDHTTKAVKAGGIPDLITYEVNKDWNW